MAFDYTALYPDTSNNGAFTKSWNYTTVVDSIATCSAPGYFNKVATRLGIGDNIAVAVVDAFDKTRTTLVDHTTLFVTGISGGVVTTLASGGVQPLAAVTSRWINSISSTGVPSATQPDATDITLSQSGVGAVSRTVASRLNELLLAKDFGVKANGIQLSATVSITSGTKNLLATGASFTAADAGKVIFVEGAGAAGGWLQSTITVFVDATHVTLNDNAGTTVTTTSKRIIYGTDDATANTAAITAARAASATLLYTGGMILHSTTQNWAYNNLRVMALSDDVVFLHTGTGAAHSFSGITNYPATQGCAGGRFGGPGTIMARGNPTGATTVGYDFDNWHFGYHRAAARDCATPFKFADTGIVGSSAVETTLDHPRVSNNTDGAFIIQPGKAFDFNKIVGCTIIKIMAEGCGASANRAVVLTGAINNLLLGGTVESNATGGISEDSTSSRNTYDNVDSEVNGTFADWTMNGKYPVLINCSGAGTTAGNTFTSTGIVLLGGKFQSLTNSDDTLWSNATEFITAFVDNGGHTTILNPIGGLAVAKENATSILGNKTINTANAVTLKINSKIVSDMVGAGPFVPAADVVGIYIAKITGVNFNSANSDNAIAFSMPAGFTRMLPWRINISHASAALNVATFGVFSAAAAGGVALIAAGTAAGVTTASEGTLGNANTVSTVQTATFVAASMATPNTVYFRVGTAQGSAATADVEFMFFIQP